MKERIVTKNFCCIFLALFFVSNIMYMLMTTMSEYTTTFGASTMVAGMVTGIYTIGGIFSRLYAGSGAQKWGWKRFAVAFMVLHLVACIFYFAVNNVAVLLLVRFVHGLGYGGAANIILTIGMSILPKSRYGEASGYFMLAPTLAIATGPYVGAYIYDTFGATGCFIMTIILSAGMLIFILAMDLKEVDPGAQKVKKIEKMEDEKENAKGLNKIFEIKAVPISICMFLFALGYGAVMSFYRLYSVETYLTTEFSYFFLIYAVVLLCTRPVAGKIQDKYFDNIIFYPGIIAQAIGLFLIAWKPCMLTIVLCGIGCGLGYGTLNSCCNSIACRQASQERRSYAVSTF
ncbi:MAG: MFS transporter [Clostridiales bacterium]|nr:MFS transporter [Clostridiales bacterium]